MKASAIAGILSLAVGMAFMSQGPSARGLAIPFKCAGVALLCSSMREEQEVSVNDLDAYGNVIRVRKFANRDQAQSYINSVKRRRA